MITVSPASAAQQSEIGMIVANEMLREWFTNFANWLAPFLYNTERSASDLQRN
jgi:hypothetical protein